MGHLQTLLTFCCFLVLTLGVTLYNDNRPLRCVMDNGQQQNDLYHCTKEAKKAMAREDDQSKAWLTLIKQTLFNYCCANLPMPTLLTIKNKNTKPLRVTLTYDGKSIELILRADDNLQYDITKHFPEYRSGLVYSVSGSLGFGRSTEAILITPNYLEDVVLFIKNIFGTTLILNPKL